MKVFYKFIFVLNLIFISEWAFGAEGRPNFLDALKENNRLMVTFYSTVLGRPAESGARVALGDITGDGRSDDKEIQNFLARYYKDMLKRPVDRSNQRFADLGTQQGSEFRALPTGQALGAVLVRDINLTGQFTEESFNKLVESGRFVAPVASDLTVRTIDTRIGTKMPRLFERRPHHPRFPPQDGSGPPRDRR